MSACPCGIKTCVNGSAKTHDRALRRRVTALQHQNAGLTRSNLARLPSFERIGEVEMQVRQFNRALQQWKAKARLLDVDLTQRYIIIQELTLKLATLIGNDAAEALVRSAVPAPFVRTLGPLAGIFSAMHANELAGQAASSEPELPLPDGFFPQLVEYRDSKKVDE